MTNKYKYLLCVQNCKDQLQDVMRKSLSTNIVIDLLQLLMPGITANYQKMSPIGSTGRALQALADLATQPKTCEQTEQLMVRILH